MTARWGWFLFFPLIASLGLLIGSQFEFLQNSFHRDLGLGRVAPALGFENYASVLQNPFYVGSIRTTIELSFYAAALGLVLGYPVAYTIARMRSRWSMLMIAAILLASLITVPIKVLGLIIIFNREGMLNRLLTGWHIVDAPVSILGNETGVVVGLIYYSLAFAVLLLYSVIKTIPVSLEDAAKIHGSSQWRAFRKVVFPLSVPGIVAVGMTVFNLSMGGFAAAALMGGGRVATLPVLIHRTIILETKYGVAATLAVILLVLTLVLNIASAIVIAYLLRRRRRKIVAPRTADRLRRLSYRIGARLGGVGDRLRDRGIRVPMLAIFNALWVAWVYLFLFAPLIVVALASLNGGSTRYGSVAFPPAHLSLDWYVHTPMAHIWAFGASMLLGVAASLIALLLALPAALGLVRGRFPGRESAAVLFRVPLQIPFIIIGVSFLYMYYAIGTHTGLALAGTFAGLVLAHAFVLMPYIVNSVAEVLRRFNLQLEEAALVHGAGRWETFRRVTLPVIAPGIFAGTVYAFMVSFGDVPIALFLAGPSFTPLPLLIYQSMDVEFDATLLSTSTAVMIVGLALLLLVQKMVGLGALLRSDASAAG